jgi:hypothetical protein
MTRRLHPWTLGIALISLLMVTGCNGGTVGPTVSLKVTGDQAGQIARNALEAYNSGDYSAWSRDWSANMKGAIGEREFLAVRERLIDRYGRCASISNAMLEPSPRSGYVRWAFTAECQSGQLRFIFAFPGDGNRAESVYVEPVR